MASRTKKAVVASHEWISDAIAAARNTTWFSLVNEDAVTSDLNEWHNDGMFKNPQQVKDRLCAYCQSQIRQIGQANFSCTL